MQKASEEIRQAIRNMNVQISLQELCHVAKVSPSQVRYWEKKGYIHSQQAQKNQNHRYSLATVIQVTYIRVLLEQGYTLQAAAEREKYRRGTIHSLKRFFSDRMGEMDIDDQQRVKMDLGPLDGKPEVHVQAVVMPDGTTKLKLIDVND